MPTSEQEQTVPTEQSGEQKSSPRTKQLEDLVHGLVEEQVVSTNGRRIGRQFQLMPRLEVQESLLTDAHRHFKQASDVELESSYAAEWLLDNFYVIEQAIRQIEEDMPSGYYRQLPKLESGPMAKMPRIYALAQEIIGYWDGQLDIERIERFVQAYQRFTFLSMGELWALPTVLRMGLLENLTWAVARITDMESELASLPSIPAALEELDDDAIVANCIPSLRTLATINWKTFFESTSRVEKVLCEDPVQVYGQMDFDTRDRYRKVIEELSLNTGSSEESVAQTAIQFAADARAELSSTDTQDMRTAHVGFYLIDDGLPRLEEHLGYRPTLGKRLARWVRAHPQWLFFGGIGLLTGLVLLALLWYGIRADATFWQLLAIFLVTLIPASTIGLNLVNWLFTHFLPPQVLPKMDFAKGIPEDCRSMVVIPALLTSSADVDSLLEQLERHFLANSDPHLSFALLTDFADAQAQHMPEDEMLLEQAKTGIQALNKKYRRRPISQRVARERTALAGDPFYLFHRERLWNPSEGCWMGWERKRGKLAEFNQLLAGSDETSYVVRLGDLHVLQAIRYIITLDSDTVLSRDTAHRLIATLAHPLNRAKFDEETGKVVAGYTVLQPRLEVEPTSANRSLFAQIFAGDIGLDLYTRAVSDVYQDLFGEGIYAGKGIYDVAAFERSLAGRVPENALLSHDLFEGIHGRAGLVTDIPFYEDYPSHYLVYARRLHRWVRGDWQLVPWLFSQVPCADDGTRPNDLGLLDRWKIFDNLRRSLFMPALLLMWLVGWLWLPGSAWLWTLFGLLALAFPVFSNVITGLLRGMIDYLLKGGTFYSVSLSATRQLLALTFLPYQSYVVLDAIIRTLVRVFISHEHLLEWTSAAHTGRVISQQDKPLFVWLKMASAPLITLGLGVLVALINPVALWVCTPLLLLWLVAPQIAYWISQPIVEAPVHLSEQERQVLRRLARQTWLFFEQFVGPDDHWLPPDHFQESPRGLVAHRTSPTNIGLLLTSTLSAYDLGYIGPLELTLRLQPTFDTMANLETYRGHLLNWYDTSNLNPLPPSYVSTVDSGNLAGCLLVVQQGCQEMQQDPLLSWRRWEGLLDTLAVLIENLERLNASGDLEIATPVHRRLEQIQQEILDVRDAPERWRALLGRLYGSEWREVEEQLGEFIGAYTDQLDVEHLRNLRIWAERVRSHLASAQRDVERLLPWLETMAQEPPALFSRPDADPVLAENWQALQEELPSSPKVVNTLPVAEICERCRDGQKRLAALQKRLDDTTGDSQPSPALRQARDWCAALADTLQNGETMAQILLDDCQKLSDQAQSMVAAMDFEFLFDSQRQVFHIGYNVESEMLDRNYYDLLASEARIASIVAIAKGDIPQSHWLHLSRPLTQVGHERTLLSWSGTMFEYLMPSLLMHSNPGTLLNQSCRAAVDYQIEYGEEKNVPWGISESGYYRFDASMNYQYQAFGTPGLGFKRGLSEDLVVTPYASLMALALRPRAVMENMAQLEELQMLGHYGFYEAIDFTTSRLPVGQQQARVRSYMVHHQGMIMLALVNYLQDGTIVKRFHKNPRIQTVELLLHEQVPQAAPIEYPISEEVPAVRPSEPQVMFAPWKAPVNTPMPQVRYLSNGNYGVLLTNTGGGYSRWGEVALTRWRADTTRDHWGNWLYLKDRENGNLWSVGQQPIPSSPEEQEVFYHPHMAEFRRHDHEITLNMKVVVSLDDDAEIREVTLTNQSDRQRHLQLTSYGEVVLAPQETDRRHPAFNKLFIESSYQSELKTLLFRRRPRSANDDPVFMAHMFVSEDEEEENDETAASYRYETDRAHFLGRHGSYQAPAALTSNGRLSNTSGSTLDPVMALSKEIVLAPHETQRFALITLVSASRQEILETARHYRAWSTINQTFDQSRSRIEHEMRQQDFSLEELHQNQQLLSLLLYPHPALRSEPNVLAQNSKGQSSLWPYGISGDYPVLLLRLHDHEQLGLVRRVVKAHSYWRKQGLKIDLVILNLQDVGYAQELHERIHRLLVRRGSDVWLNQRGGIFLIRAEQLSEADNILLSTVARVTLDSEEGHLSDQLAHVLEQRTTLPRLVPTRTKPEAESAPALSKPADLQFDNGFGGFSADGKEYVIYQAPGQQTPAPWINVIANHRFGFLVSETGSGYTWAENSGENRLTPWNNDPVQDPPGEAIYLRDEETGQIWTPTPQPVGAQAPYLVRHGAGYTVFEHNSHSLAQRLRLFTPPEDPLKVMQLRLENTTDQPRRITATFYGEWVLGTSREEMQQYVVPTFDNEHQALLARNPYNTEFAERVAFVAGSQDVHSITVDRTEFLGRLGDYRHPVALDRVGLSGTVETGRDPCAALQLHVDLPPNGTEEIFFLVGEGADEEESLALLGQYRNAAAVAEAWKEMTHFWDDLLETVHVQTPDDAMDLLLNRWLLYQALSCRIWGRSAFYQSSGAFGFRDQLQDVMSAIHARPQDTRAQILRAARHQFEAGDVLHWWHPPSGRGVRTRITDDLLWLPFVTAQYVESTGDASVLDETAPFLRGDPLKPDEEERYGQYGRSEDEYPIFEHCRRALHKTSERMGEHGLPLMGSGDWNDGMNRVGIEGEGESVWLGWFYYACLTNFAQLCEQTGKTDLAHEYQQQAQALQEALETHAWDGAWYRRAYYDDGTPLGSSQNQECQIDAIAQSWSVISGAAQPDRARQAMESVAKRLIRQNDRLLLLFTPPFDETPRDPGYIKGYPPGIRENGGQYTHAALWTVWAFAQLGQGDRAGELFQLLNPICHSDTHQKAKRYRVEPYVVVADVYSVPPHVGRGGWTWYTGSSGWMYRLGLEAILGLRRVGDVLRIDPAIPREWPGYQLRYRYNDTCYQIQVDNLAGVNQGVKQVLVDGEQTDGDIPLVDDGQTHHVRVEMG